eukprot:CAMPEP_0183433186 /NCGR_PEP_ID=MMETSP0370-20130417/61226_1 /TAXON_ID=268820 /ORGANISM="Peridinium aciculiferum, Strain PAER-2" /LENGTH=39 /DNA_ID= /DNA_START= /DNA_END= /DNA_ORIENTATION=
MTRRWTQLDRAPSVQYLHCPAEFAAAFIEKEACSLATSG